VTPRRISDTEALGVSIPLGVNTMDPGASRPFLRFDFNQLMYKCTRCILGVHLVVSDAVVRMPQVEMTGIMVEQGNLENGYAHNSARNSAGT
jgi:hypothetical protein